MKFRLIIIFILLLGCASVAQAATAEYVNIGVTVGEPPTSTPTTTPPVTPTTTPSPGGVLPIFDFTPPAIYNLGVSELDLISAKIVWETNELTFCKLSWGQTADYENESILEISFALNHAMELRGLTPKTDYHYKVICYDRNHNSAETDDQLLTTLSPVDTAPPANVAYLTAIPGEERVMLSWQNPPEADFSGVKIYRSDVFYPRGEDDGALIYEGKGEFEDNRFRFLDTGLAGGVRYYYTVISFDRSGNYASGAVVSAVPRLRAILPGEEGAVVIPAASTTISTLPPPAEALVREDICSPEEVAEEEMPAILSLELKDFDFIQDKKVEFDGNKIDLDIGKRLVVSVDSAKIPASVRNLIITIHDVSHSYPYFFSLDSESGEYVSSMVLPQNVGFYPFTITLYGQNHQLIKRMYGVVSISVHALSVRTVVNYWPWYFWVFLLILAMILSVVIIGLIVAKRKHVDNNVDKI